MLSTFRRITNMVLCVLALQNCQSSLNITSDSDELPAAATSVSGLHARRKNRSLIAEPSAPSSTSELLNLSTISPAAVASQIQQEVSRAQSHTPSSMAPSEITIQPTEMHSQNTFRAFETSSGEQVVFKQVGDQWHAEVRSNVYKSQRTLPVVSTVPIGSFLSWLQKQDARTSKSRIRTLNTSHPLYDCCVYLGKMGLSGGMPASEKKTEWLQGPSIALDSNETLTEVYHIPFGYRYKDYRVKQDPEPIIQRASCTIYYVEAQSLEEINKLAECTNGGELEAKLAADSVNVVTLGKLEGSTQHSVSKAHQDMQASDDLYAALIVYGDTKTSRALCKRGQIYLELEIEVEEKTEKDQEQQIPFHEEMPPQSYEEQVNELKKEIDASFRKKDTSLPMKMLNSEEKAKMECECEKKLPAVQQEEVSEQEYAQLLKQQEDSPKETQTVLRACITELSGSQAPEQQQLQILRMPAIVFGASAWKKYYGEVGAEPRLPDNIGAILNRPCPFWKGKKIRDTHLLMLIPARVNQRPFSLNLLGKLIQNPQGDGYRTEYKYYGKDVQNQIGAASPQASYWLLMTRNVLPESRIKIYKKQKKIVNDHASRTGLPYLVPKALEAATVILLHHVHSGEQLYSDNPWTYTRCQELIRYKSGMHPAIVGGFASSGLHISSSRFGPSNYDGVAVCWRL